MEEYRIKEQFLRYWGAALDNRNVSQDDVHLYAHRLGIRAKTLMEQLEEIG